MHLETRNGILVIRKPMMDSQHLSEAILEACQIWALFQSVLHTIRLEFHIKIDQLFEILPTYPKFFNVNLQVDGGRSTYSVALG